MQRAAAFALLALVCIQAAAAFPKYEEKRSVYEPVKKPVYEPKKVEVVVVKKPVPSPKPSPKPEPITIKCLPKPVTVSAKANITCPEGYTLVGDAKLKYTCTKKVCIIAAPVPAPKKYVPKGKHYFVGKKVEVEKKPVYEPVKKPVYEPVKKPMPPPPSPSPVQVCNNVHEHPFYVCAKGYTLSGKHCLLSVAGPCPAGFTPAHGYCTKTYIPEPVKKPVYEPKKAHYFLGKFHKGEDKEESIKYCEYPEPKKEEHKPKYEDKHEEKHSFDPKAKLMSLFGKH